MEGVIPKGDNLLCVLIIPRYVRSEKNKRTPHAKETVWGLEALT
jgi:hypothetical protein